MVRLLFFLTSTIAQIGKMRKRNTKKSTIIVSIIIFLIFDFAKVLFYYLFIDKGKGKKEY
jgi:hypothetical protein